VIEAIAQLIAEKLELKNWSSRVLLMPMGYDLLANKFTIEIKGPNVSKMFIVKVSSSYGLNDLVLQEADNIISLVKLGVKGIPAMILHGILDGRQFVVHEFIVGKKPRSSEGTFDEAYNITKEWLQILCSRTANKPIEPESLITKATSFNSIISEFFPFSESIHLMEKLAPICAIPTSWVHGDFWHGNLIIEPNKKLWVTDFAFSAEGEPPIDVLDLVSDYKPSLFFSPERLSAYTDRFIPKGINPLFLVHYFLNRKIAMKVKSKKRLYDELLVLNLGEELTRIPEAGILHDVIMRTK
jgi:hypothetical protein